MSITFLPESYLKFNTFASFNDTANFIEINNNVNHIKGGFVNFAGNQIFTQTDFIFPNYRLLYLKDNVNRCTSLFCNACIENLTSINVDIFNLDNTSYILLLHNPHNINNFPSILSINNVSVNAYCFVKIDKVLNEVSYMDVNNFNVITKSINPFRILTETERLLINIGNTFQTTNTIYFHGAVVKNYINLRYNLILNPLTLFYDNIHTASIFYDELCVNSNSIFTEIDTFFGSIPVYYPKFLILHNNAIYKYDKENNNFIVITQSNVNFNYINENGNSITDLNYISLQLVLNQFNTDKLILLTNGWLLPYLLYFEIGNRKFIYINVSSESVNEMVVAEI